MADLSSVETMHVEWCRLIKRNQHKLLRPIQVGKAHSGIAPEVNEQAISAFKRGDTQILIATTLVECGLTVPELHHVLIYSPDRLGAVTLHQIRGRGARAGGTCYFDMFLPKPVSEASIARLEQIRVTTDGFELAQIDLNNRGAGDISELGTEQHGASNTGIFGMKVSLSLLEEINDLLQVAPTKRISIC